jgi:D-alanine transaminase
MNESSIIASYNGKSLPLTEVFAPVLDRAFMFSDAVYEVLRVYKGKPFLLSAHTTRLQASLRSMRIAANQDFGDAILNNIAENQVKEGMVYLQISRGVAPRNHSFFAMELKPSILIYTKPFLEHPAAKEQQTGIKGITHEDYRWGRCDIKTTNLLANCLIQTHANEMGAQEAILIRNGVVSEGTSSNVFIVKNGIFITPPKSTFILAGTRRQFLIDGLLAAGHSVIERQVEKTELFNADEIFISSTVKEVTSVVQLDQKPVGKGIVGPFAKLAQALLDDAILAMK